MAIGPGLGLMGSGGSVFIAGVFVGWEMAQAVGMLLFIPGHLIHFAEGVTRVLVEGGPTIAGAFLAADLVDEVVIGHGTETLGSKGRMPVGDHGLEFLARGDRWQTVEERGIGADRLSVHRRTGRFASEPTP